MMKQMESISSAFQEQAKTNSILAGTLNMLVEQFARMKERITSVQKENTNLQGQLEAVVKRLKALETKPAANVLTPRTTYSKLWSFPSSCNKYQTLTHNYTKVKNERIQKSSRPYILEPLEK
jgi:septal ring factor EnvC (AmiA/AmiB activator)